jgi:hypothetical protein
MALATDPELKPVYNNPRFAAVVSEARQQAAPAQNAN